MHARTRVKFACPVIVTPICFGSSVAIINSRRRRELFMTTELAKQMGVTITGQANLTLVRAYTIGSYKAITYGLPKKTTRGKRCPPDKS